MRVYYRSGRVEVFPEIAHFRRGGASLAGQPHSHTRSESGRYEQHPVPQKNVIIA